MANKDKNKTASVNETMKNLIDSEYAQMKKEGKIPKDEQVFKKTEPQYTTSKPVITSSPKRNSKQVQTQEKDEDKEKKKRKGLVLGLCLGLGIPIIAGLTASTIYFALNGGSGKQYVTTITEKSCEGAGTFDNNIWTLNGNAETSTVTFTTDSSIPVDKQEWTLSNAIDGEEVSFAGLMLTNPTADTPATITATVGDIYEKEIVYIQLRDKSTTPSTIVSYLKIQVLPNGAIVPKNTTISGNETITLTSGADAEHATTKQTYNITLYSEAGTVLTDWNTFWSYKIPENLPSGVKITFTPDKTDTRKGELEIDVQNAHLPSDQTITVTLNGYTQGYITESQTKTITINVLTDYKINRTIVSNLNPEVQELNLVAGSVRNDTADFKCQFATYDGRILDPGTNKADWSCGVVSGTAPTGFSLDIQPDVNDPNQSKLTVNASECVNDQETRITIRVYADVKDQPLQVSNIGHYDINIVIEPIGTKNQIVYNGTPVEIQTPIDLNAFCEPNAGDWEIPTDDQGNKIKIEDKSLLTQINVIAHTSGTTLGNNFLKDCTGLTTVNLNSLNDIDHVGDDFMSGCTNINHLDLSGLSGVTTIGSSFLANCNGFTKPVDFSPLANVTTIGDKFLLNTDLSTIDLSSMTSLTTTGDNFLNGCTNLTSFNLSPLVSLQTIGNHFMDGCSSLKYCNFGTDLDKVTAIGTHFFNGCSELQFVNLGGLTNTSLTIDGDYFLYDCNSLQYINMAGITSAKITNGGNTTFGTTSEKTTATVLTGTDMTQILTDYANATSTPFRNLARAENKVTYNNQEVLLEDNINPQDLCTFTIDGEGKWVDRKITLPKKGGGTIEFSNPSLLTSLTLQSCDATITDISANEKVEGFLSFFNGLETIDITGLCNLTTIGYSFLYENKSLLSIDLSPLSNVKSVNALFLTTCESLTSVDCTPMQSLKTIGDGFLAYCSGLLEVNISHLQNLEIIGGSFLFNDTNLTNVNLFGLNNLQQISAAFLSECRSLNTPIDLRDSLKLKYIGSEFLNNCRNLIHLYVPFKANTPALQGWGETIGRPDLPFRIHCGNYIQNYQSANTWKLKAAYMEA